MKPATLKRIFASAEVEPAQQPSRDDLILKFLPMVERIARRECRKQRSYGNGFISLEDIRGELTLSLVRLIDRFQDGRSDSVEAYLAIHLAWRSVDAVNESAALRDSCAPFVNISGQEAICVADLPGSLGTGYVARGRRRGVDGTARPIPVTREPSADFDAGALLGALVGVDRAVVEAYLKKFDEAELDGKPDPSQADVAAALGISQAAVSRSLKIIRALVHKASART